MRHRLYFHIVWTTRDRLPLIDGPAATLIARIARQAARQERGRLLDIGIVATHVHALVALHPLSLIPRMLQRMKGASSHLINRERRPANASLLHWDSGYNIETVSPQSLNAARRYVRNQPRHHPGDAIPDWSPPHLGTEALR
ncbi:MAG TPA: IS200/IS605 family transposase [Gemmatimonadales bacterium]|nr:IS200/IS605 family transposase [Gemmatimonadales bacterium]